jgi:hypothetical protein
MQINEKVMINDELSVLDAVATDGGEQQKLAWCEKTPRRGEMFR